MARLPQPVSLFASDEALHQLQADARRARPNLMPDEQRALVDDLRELRMHQRMRQFAWLLFVLPVLFAAVEAGGRALAAWWLG